MTEREKFVAELSKKLLGDILRGAWTGGKLANPEQCADLAVQAAVALYDRLSKPLP